MLDGNFLFRVFLSFVCLFVLFLSTPRHLLGPLFLLSSMSMSLATSVAVLAGTYAALYWLVWKWWGHPKGKQQQLDDQDNERVLREQFRSTTGLVFAVYL